MSEHLFLRGLGLVILLSLLGTQPVFASEPKDCGGFLYRAKRDGVPVYELPDVTSAVVQKLKLGDKVCYIGERDRFAIVEWEKKDSAEGVIGTAFVKKTDLWESTNRGKGKKPAPAPGIVQRVKNYFNYLKYGGVPDLPIIPYDPTNQ